MVTPPKRLTVENLESRDVPTTWSVPWDDPSHLTVSFVPDGTSVGGNNSTLFANMKADGYNSTTQWQGVIFNALNTWASVAGVHFAQVADGGQPLGTQGAVQGDLRFGDIRIASRPLTSNLAAMASPFTWTGSTWSGDIVLNANSKFSSNGATGTYDLFSVVLHEAGHALGLDDGNDTSSVMCEDYTPHTSLSSTDIQAIQSLYGAALSPTSPPTSPPPIVSPTASTTSSTSSAYTKMYGQYSGALTKSSQVDTYSVTAPAANSTAPMNLIVYVRAKNASTGLTPQLSVKNATNQAVSYEVISNESGWVSVQVLNVTPGAVYQLGVFDTLLGKNTLYYGMGVQFNQDPPIHRNLIAADSLSATKTTNTGSISLTESRLLSFSLCSTWNGDTNVQMTVTDSTGKVVVQLTSGPNALPPTAEVFLDAGTYKITYRAFSPTGKSIKNVQFVAMVDTLNDPVGTYAPTSTTTTTTTTSIAPPPDYTTTGVVDTSISPIYLYYY